MAGVAGAAAAAVGHPAAVAAAGVHLAAAAAVVGRAEVVAAEAVGRRVEPARSSSARGLPAVEVEAVGPQAVVEVAGRAEAAAVDGRVVVEEAVGPRAAVVVAGRAEAVAAAVGQALYLVSPAGSLKLCPV